MQQNIFRKAAVERMSTPDRIDQLMQVTSSKGWLALFTVVGLLVAVVIWGFTGSISVELKGQAILIKPDGLRAVQASGQGTLTDFALKPGDSVKTGQVIGKLHTGTDVTNLVSPFDGVVNEVLAANDTLLTTGANVAQVETAAPLQAFAFVSLQDGKTLEPGTKIQLSPSTAQAGQYGFLMGQVKYVSQYPATQQGLQTLFNNPSLVQVIMGNGPVVQVEVTLDQDAATATGFKWSASSGPASSLTSGTLCSANFVLSQVAPINLVLPVKN